MSKTSESPLQDLRASMKRCLQWAFSVALFVALFALFLPNYYKSEARLLPVGSKGSGALGGLASAAAAFGVMVPGGDSTDANFVDILNSRWLKERLLQTEFQYRMKQWRFGPEMAEKGTLYSYLHATNMDRAVSSVNGVVFATRDLKTKIITISAETRSPELSQLIVQRAEMLLEDFLHEQGRAHGAAQATFTKARLAEARREMDEAEGNYRRFLEANRNSQTSSEPSVRLEGSRLETELRLCQQLVSTIAMSHEQALLDEKNDVPIVDVLDAGNLPLEKSRPSRSLLVIVSFLVTAIGVWTWLNRAWVKAHLIENES